MSECKHEHCYKCPTIENSWGIEDTHDIKCSKCHTMLYAKLNENESDKIILERGDKCESS